MMLNRFSLFYCVCLLFLCSCNQLQTDNGKNRIPLSGADTVKEKSFARLGRRLELDGKVFLNDGKTPAGNIVLKDGKASIKKELRKRKSEEEIQKMKNDLLAVGR